MNTRRARRSTSCGPKRCRSAADKIIAERETRQKTSEALIVLTVLY
jgi:hypothetical protein